MATEWRQRGHLHRMTHGIYGLVYRIMLLRKHSRCLEASRLVRFGAERDTRKSRKCRALGDESYSLVPHQLSLQQLDVLIAFARDTTVEIHHVEKFKHCTYHNNVSQCGILSAKCSTPTSAIFKPIFAKMN